MPKLQHLDLSYNPLEPALMAATATVRIYGPALKDLKSLHRCSIDSCQGLLRGLSRIQAAKPAVGFASVPLRSLLLEGCALTSLPPALLLVGKVGAGGRDSVPCPPRHREPLRPPMKPILRG